MLPRGRSLEELPDGDKGSEFLCASRVGEVAAALSLILTAN